MYNWALVENTLEKHSNEGIILQKAESSISTYNTNNGKMNIPELSGCINRVKL